MKKPLKILFWLIGLMVMAAISFIGVMWALEWRPEPIEARETLSQTPDTISCDTLKIITWNIGYTGLGAEMDFFYDGGTRVRTSQEETSKNLHGVINFLKSHADADFILLQEVDFGSKRSFNTNQYDSIRTALPQFMGWWGYNYVSQFVPYPITEPIGRVKSGIVTLSKWAPAEVTRFQYPGEFAFPVRIFNLKRCLLTASFEVAGSGNRLYINNTHNTAYDTGGMRSGEMQFLRGYLNGKPLSVTAGDWNSTPPGYTASRAAREDPNFSPMALTDKDFDAGFRFIYDTTTMTARYLDEPFEHRTTTQTMLDFALCGPRIEPISVETVDLGFVNSDHNPVIFVVKIR